MTFSTSQPNGVSGPQNDRSFRPGSWLARRVCILCVATALIALLCAPALVGVASADAGVAELASQGDDSEAATPTITADSERPMVGTEVEFRLSSEGSVDRVQWEVVAPNGTVTASKTYARDNLDVDWTNDIVWNTSDPTGFSHEFSAEGDYTVRATYGQQPATVERTVSVRPVRLTASLAANATQPVVGEPFFVLARATGNVTNSSLDYDGGETLRALSTYSPISWLFPEALRLQLHTFHEPGEHEIVYTVENATGASAVNRTTVDVRPETAQIDARLESTSDEPGTEQPLNRTVEFDASDTVGNVSEYVWLFGDGSYDRTSAPTTTHDYAENGSYEAVVIAVGPNATDRASTQSTFGSTAQDARISTSHENVTVDDLVRLRVEPTLGSIKEYRWQFSDGSRTNSTFAFTSHSWSEPGTFTASVTLVPFAGEPETLYRSITVGSGPSIDVTVESESVVAGRPVRLNATSEYASFTDYEWTLSDGRTEVNADSSIWHVFDEPGQYDVEVVGQEGVLGGPRTVANETITVSENPSDSYDLELSASTTTPVTHQPVRFEATAPDWEPTEYWWKVEEPFGDLWHRTQNASFVGDVDITSDENVSVIAIRGNATGRASTRIDVSYSPSETIDVDPAPPTVGGNVTFSVEHLDGHVTDVQWAIDGREIGSGLSTRHEIESRDVYEVTAEGTDVAGDHWQAARRLSIESPADGNEGNNGDDGNDDDGNAGTFLAPTTDTSPPAPSFEIQSIDVPEEVEPGSDVEVSVQTENDGGAGDAEVTVWLPDSAQQRVEASAGSDEVDVVTTTIAAPAEPGEYDLQVETASDEQTATLSVAGSTGEGAENDTEPAPPSGNESVADGDGTPAFGVLGSLLALAAGALAVRRRS